MSLEEYSFKLLKATKALYPYQSKHHKISAREHCTVYKENCFTRRPSRYLFRQ